MDPAIEEALREHVARRKESLGQQEPALEPIGI